MISDVVDRVLCTQLGVREPNANGRNCFSLIFSSYLVGYDISSITLFEF